MDLPPEQQPSGAPPPQPGDRPRFHRSTLSRWTIRLGSAAALAVCGLVGTIAMAQRSMIYHPRPEPPGLALPPDARRLFFQTADGRQAAIYLPPPGADPAKPPPTLWVVCSGNASIGSDWLGFMQRSVRVSASECRAGILLVDYPGYGLCVGRPSEAGISRTMAAVLDALATDRGWAPGDLRRDLRVLGFSLGSGAAMMLAEREPVTEILLLAPFTSLRDAARGAVGPLLSKLVVDHFDNRSRMREMAARTPPPRLTILHGTRDNVIPHSHSEELARIYGPKARLLLVEGADHTLGDAKEWAEVVRRLQAGE